MAPMSETVWVLLHQTYDHAWPVGVYRTRADALKAWRSDNPYWKDTPDDELEPWMTDDLHEMTLQ